MYINITVTTSGPIFDGRAPGIVQDFCRAAEDHIGDIGVNRIRVYLPTQYMYLGNNGGDPKHNPVPSDAGYLAEHIQWERDTPSSINVNDGGYPAVIYGPWIEGIAPGNEYFGVVGRTKRGLPPRFPGYHAFQKIYEQLDVEAADLAQEVLPPYLVALNG